MANKNVPFVGVKERDGKFIAAVSYFTAGSTDLFAQLQQYDFTRITLMETRKEAQRIAQMWNDGWRAEGKLYKY